MSKQAVTKADKAVQVAYTRVRQWEDKARDARSKAADLEADSGREILAGASAHEIAVKINAADLEAKAYDNAATEARTQLAEARTALLKAHAADYDQQAEKARQARDQMDEEADALKAQLHDLTGEEWGIVTPALKIGESRLVSAHEKAHTLPRALNTAGAWVRYYLAHGRHPRDYDVLREFSGSTEMDNGGGLCDPANGPEVFARLAELEAEAGLNAPESTRPEPAKPARRRAREVYDEDDISEFDPVEDADLISRMGISK